MWFKGSDSVSIHTLAHAAYEIIHAISKQPNPERRSLLFDSLAIETEYRRLWEKILKEPANIFKHANQDGKQILEYDPELAESFILFSIVGVELCSERLNAEESGYMYWQYFHRPESLTEQGREMFVEKVPVDTLKSIRAIPKSEFLKGFLKIYGDIRQ